MLNRRYFLSAAAIGAASAFAFSPLASAMSAQTYSDKAFSAAQAAGKPILLHITAPWCPTCKAQKPILSKLEAEPKFKGLVTFNIDFDTSKPLLRKLHVAQQSTLIVYKGKKEMGRSTGDTDPASIAALLGKVI
jgi:thioredoxin